MAKKPTKKSDPAKKRADLADRLRKAKANREKNSGLLKEVREDPEMAERVKALMCEDLRRVAEIPRTLLMPSSSRDRYREHGDYSTSLATYLFGLWPEFQRKAGLADSLGVRQVHRNISKTSRAQDVANYADEHVKPWDGAYNSLDLSKEEITLQVGSDFHVPWLDPFARRVWMDVAKQEQPDGIRYNGDGPDFPSLSRHRQLPGHFALNLQEEIDEWVSFMSETNDASPDSDKKWLLGNHDIRLITALADSAPIYSTLRCLEFAELFKLDELKTGLVARSSFLNPTSRQRKIDVAENWETIADLWTTVHGFLCGKDAPRKHMTRFMRCGTNGHLHDEQVVSGGSDATGVIQWYQTGCMAYPPAVAREYMPGPIQAHGWVISFLLVTLFPQARQVTADFARIGEEVATFRGRVWHITQEERDQRAAMMEVL